MKKVSCIITTEGEARNQRDAVQRAIHGRGALAVLIIYPYCDASSGNWYYYFCLVCTNALVVQQTQRLGWKEDDTKDLCKGEGLICLHSLHKCSCCVTAQRNTHMCSEAIQVVQQLERIL